MRTPSSTTVARVAAAASVAVAALLAATAAHAAGAVQVRFLQPEKFSDIGFGGVERDRSLSALRAHFQKLAARLPDGQTLNIDVSDVDLAGRMEPTRQGHDLRVLRGTTDWPRIKLHYTLLDGSTTLKQADADLRDMNYLVGGPALSARTTELGYEQRMIDAWFDKTFVAAPPH